LHDKRYIKILKFVRWIFYASFYSSSHRKRLDVG